MKVDTPKITRLQQDGKGRGVSRFTPGQQAKLEHQEIVDVHTNTGHYAADPNGLLSAKEAADLLGMSLAWLYQSDVPCVRIGSRRLYRRVDLLEYIQQRLCPTQAGRRI